MNQEIHRIVAEAIAHARSRRAVVVDLPHLALAISDMADRNGSGSIRSGPLEAIAAQVELLRRRDDRRDGAWTRGAVPVSTAFRAWLRSMESVEDSEDISEVLRRAIEGLTGLVGDASAPVARGRGSLEPLSDRSSSRRSGATPPYVFEFTPEALARFEPYVGNESLVRLTLGVLTRRRKRHPVLVGPAGVGKTALVAEIARQVTAGRVPERLKGARVYQVDLGTAVAGTRYRGDFEERMAWLSRELLEEPNSIFFIDEIHLVLNVGGGEGGIDAASLLKPALSSGVGALIGATTADQARRLEGDAPLARRLVFVPVAEPSLELTRVILEKHAETLQEELSLEIGEDVIDAALRAGARLRPHRHLPDSAIDILELAASLFAVDKPPGTALEIATIDSVAQLITEGIKTPAERSRDRLLRLFTDRFRPAR